MPSSSVETPVAATATERDALVAPPGGPDPSIEAPAVALVTPVANERATIERTWAAIESLPIDDLIWIPVLDSVSLDGTREWLSKRARIDERVRPLDLGPARGLARAYLEGYREAVRIGAAKIVEIDAGGSHPVSLVSEIVAALDEVPHVATTRNDGVGGYVDVPLGRRLLSRFGTWVGKGVLGIPLSDCTGGLQGFRRDALGAFHPEDFLSRAHMVQTELKYRFRHLPHREIPLTYHGSDSTLRWTAVADAARVTLRLFLDRVGLARIPRSGTP